jgi:hypothetical protein
MRGNATEWFNSRASTVSLRKDRCETAAPTHERTMNSPEQQNQSHNPYAPPIADITPTAQGDDAPHFYVVSQTKFLVLFFATMSVYSVYWFYRHWRVYRDVKNDIGIWPIPRGIFSIFFAHSLFRVIDERLKTIRAGYIWSPSALATGWVVLSILSNILSRIATRMDSIGLDLLSVALILPLAFCLLGAQKAANRACGDVDGESNNTFTAANYAWIALGLIFWLASLWGLYILHTEGAL